MRPKLCVLAGGALAGLALAGCNPTGDVGYVEIKTVPVAQTTTTGLYLDATKVAPIKQGSAVLRQPVGTIKLQADGLGGQPAMICNVEVRKNRITTVTISVLERPPRCQCRFGGPAHSGVPQTCVS